ncbi:hypothetical protein ACJX0J_006518, partial [Zea mays]
EKLSISNVRNQHRFLFWETITAYEQTILVMIFIKTWKHHNATDMVNELNLDFFSCIQEKRCTRLYAGGVGLLGGGGGGGGWKRADTSHTYTTLTIGHLKLIANDPTIKSTWHKILL